MLSLYQQSSTHLLLTSEKERDLSYGKMAKSAQLNDQICLDAGQIKLQVQQKQCERQNGQIQPDPAKPYPAPKGLNLWPNQCTGIAKDFMPMYCGIMDFTPMHPLLLL